MSKKQNRAFEAPDPTRRKLLSTGAISAAAAATAAVLGTSSTAQETPPDTAPQVIAQQPLPDSPGEFTGQCVFITGGARGIGYACAEEFAKA